METLEARLMAAMADMANPTKGSTAKVPTKSGKEFSYQYETLEQVLDIVKTACAEHGIMMRQGVLEAMTEAEATFRLVTYVFDGERSLALDSRPLKFTGDAQKDGSLETYMRRYALKTAFGLCGEDDDGAAATRKPARATESRSKDAYGSKGGKDSLTAAKKRYAAAVKAAGYDPKEMAAELPCREDYDPSSVDFWNARADDWEQA